ncbi:MAG: hypothetical protein JW789_01400 [Candidatus Aenigmarchaeota archaeon]|nr:hypothetical protein [Candidatus Aenigmarchaeota archaeon]
MEVEFRPGFTIYRKKGRGISWIAPHSGHSFWIPDSRDEETDTVASLCWMKEGGNLLLADTPRSRDFGIDFNRAAPGKKDALSYHMKYETREMSNVFWSKYMDKYAWTASDERDHNMRLGIYRDFWNSADEKDSIVIIHRMMSRLSNSYSVMDVTGFGISASEMEKAVKSVNRKFRKVFDKRRNDFIDFILLLAHERFHYIHDKLDIEHVFNEFYDQDLKFLGIDECTENGFVETARLKMKKMKPEVTFRKFFIGKLSHGIKNISRGKKVLQIEVSSFLCNWYPDIASIIITKLSEELLVKKK